MPSPCSGCGGHHCGLESAECIYAGTGPALQGILPVKPACVMPAPTQQLQPLPVGKQE